MYYDILQRVMRQLDSLQQKLSSSYLDSQIAATDYGKTVDTYFDISSLSMRNSILKGDNLQNATIPSSKIQDSAVTNSKIQDSAITSSKIGEGSIDSLSKFSSDLQQALSEKRLSPMSLEEPNFGDNDFKYKINPMQSPSDCNDTSVEYFDNYTTISETNLDSVFSDVTGDKHLFDVFKNRIYTGTLPVVNDLQSIYLFFEYRLFHNNIVDSAISDYPKNTKLHIQFGFFNTYNVPTYQHNGSPIKFLKDELSLYVPQLDNSAGLDNLHSYFAGSNKTLQFTKGYDWNTGDGLIASDTFNLSNYTSSLSIPLYGSDSSELSTYSYPFSGEAGMCAIKLPINLNNLVNILGGKSVSTNFLSPFLANFTVFMWLENDDYFKTTDNPYTNRFFKFKDSGDKFVIDTVGIRQISLFYSNTLLSNDASDTFYKPGVSKYIYGIDYSSVSPVPNGLQQPVGIL